MNFFQPELFDDFADLKIQFELMASVLSYRAFIGLELPTSATGTVDFWDNQLVSCLELCQILRETVWMISGRTNGETIATLRLKNIDDFKLAIERTDRLRLC